MNKILSFFLSLFVFFSTVNIQITEASALITESSSLYSASSLYDDIKGQDFVCDIADSFKGGSDDLVIIVQDAHSNFKAQRQEWLLLRELKKTYGINSFFTEGLYQTSLLDLFRFYPNSSLKGDFFFRSFSESEISPLDYLLLLSDSSSEQIPIEEKDLYLKNVAAAHKVMENSSFKILLENLKGKVNTDRTKYSPAAREVALLNDCGDVSFDESVKRKTQLLECLAGGVVDSKLGFDDYPALRKIMENQSADITISDDVLNEIENCANDYLKKYSKSLSLDVERFSEVLALLIKGVSLALTKTEVQSLRDIELLSILPDAYIDSDADLDVLVNGYEDILAFYDLVEARDTVFKSVLSKVSHNTSLRSAFFTGGFHAQEILDHCRKNDISCISFRPKAIDPDYSPSLYIDQLSRQSDTSTIALVNAFQEERDIRRLFLNLYKRHCSDVSELSLGQFSELIAVEIRKDAGLNADKKQWLLNSLSRFSEQSKYHDYETVYGSNQSFRARGELQRSLSSFKDGELHIVAAGGGGDLKGAVLFARKMIDDLQAQGKTVRKVRFFTSNLKRDKENSVGGLTPMDSIGFFEGNEFKNIPSFKDAPHFYPLNRVDYIAGTNIFGETDLLNYADGLDDRPLKGLSVTDMELRNTAPIFENDLIKALDKYGDLLPDYEIIITDAAPGGEVLADEYHNVSKGIEGDILTFTVDMGGDIFARFKDEQTPTDYAHPEYNVRSPNTDAVYLDMASALKSKYSYSSFLAVSALGGDGEISEQLYSYLSDLKMEGFFDYVQAFKDKQDLISRLRSVLRVVPSEVSTNLVNGLNSILRDEAKLSQLARSLSSEVVLSDFDRTGSFIRNKSRVVRKMPHYYKTLFFDPLEVKSKIEFDVLRNTSPGWYEIDSLIREQKNYLTEMNDPNNIYARLKANCSMAGLSMKRAVKDQKINQDDLQRFFYESKEFIPRLAAIKVMSDLDSDFFGECEAALVSDLRTQVSDMNPLVASFALETLANLQSKSPELILLAEDILKKDVVRYDDEYRGFDCWAARTAATKILDKENKEDESKLDLVFRQLVRFYKDGSFDEARINGQSYLQSIVDSDPEISRYLLKAIWEEAVGESSLAAPDYLKMKYYFTLLAAYCRMLTIGAGHGDVPANIEYLIRNDFTREAAELIVDAVSQASFDNKSVYEKGYVCFKKLARICDIRMVGKKVVRKTNVVAEDRSGKGLYADLFYGLSKDGKEYFSKAANFAKDNNKDALKEVGLVTISGGGGAKLLPDVSFNSLFFSEAEGLPVVMFLPSYDDGGSTGKLLHFYKEKYNIEFPAIGDSMNALATLAQREGYFSLHSLIRYRFDTSLDVYDAFVKKMQAEINTLAEDKSINARMQSAVIRRFAEYMLPAVKKFSDMNLLPDIKGHSLGNILWLAAASHVTGIFDRDIGVEPEHLNAKELENISKYLSAAMSIQTKLALPSSVSPATLYVRFDEIISAHADSFDAIQSGDVSFESFPFNIDGSTVIDAKDISFYDECDEGIVSEDSGYSVMEMDIEDGKRVTIKNRIKLSSGKYRDYSLDIFTDNGEYYIQYRGGRISGLDKEWVMLAQDQKYASRLCCAQVSVSSDGRLRVRLDRSGMGTLFEEQDGDSYIVKGAYTVRQTNITESYNHSKANKLGFCFDQKVDSHELVADIIRHTKVGVVIGPGSPLTSIIPVLMEKSVRNYLRQIAEAGLPVVFVMNPLIDNETNRMDILDLMRLVEDACTEPVFGMERGGFVNAVFINDTAQADKNVTDRIYDEIKNGAEGLRAAEQIRGIFSFDDDFLNKVKVEYGKGCVFYTTQNALGLIEKEIRSLGDDKKKAYSVGFQKRVFDIIMETVMLKGLRDEVKATDLYRKALRVTGGNEAGLEEVVQKAKYEDYTNSDIDILRQICDVVERKKPNFFNKRMLVLNYAEIIAETDVFRGKSKGMPISQDLINMMEVYLESGGYITLISGNSFERINAVLFDAEYGINKKYYSRIYTVVNGGSMFYRGKTFLGSSAYVLDEQVNETIAEVLAIYGIDLDSRLRSSLNGSFMSISMHDYTNLASTAVEVINQKIRDNENMSDEHKELYYIDAFSSGLTDGFDLRRKVRDVLAKRLGADLGQGSVDLSGKGSIDVSAFDASMDIADFLRGVMMDLDIDRSSMAFIAGSRRVLSASKHFEECTVMGIPALFPGVVLDEDVDGFITGGLVDFRSSISKIFKSASRKDLAGSQRDAFAVLEREILDAGVRWPIAPAASGVEINGEFLSEVNDIGKDEHAEVRLIFKVLMDKAESAKRQDITQRLEKLMLKAARTKINDDIEDLVQISDELGSPFKGKEVFITMEPCEGCMRKLYALGVKRIVYAESYFRYNSAPIIKELQAKEPERGFSCEQVSPEVSKEVHDYYRLLKEFRTKDYYEEMKARVTDVYVEIRNDFPELLPFFREYLKKRVLGVAQGEADAVEELLRHLSLDRIRLFKKHKELLNKNLDTTCAAWMFDIDETLTERLFEDVPEDMVEFVLEKAREGVLIAFNTGRVDHLICEKFLNSLMKKERRPSVLKNIYIYPAFGAFGYRLDQRASDPSSLNTDNYVDVPNNVKTFYSELMSESVREEILEFLYNECIPNLGKLEGFHVDSRCSYLSKVEFFYAPDSGGEYTADHLKQIKKFLLEAKPKIDAFIKKNGYDLKVKVGRRTVEIFPAGVSKRRALDDFLERTGLDVDQVAKFGDKGKSADADMFVGRNSYCVWKTDHDKENQVDVSLVTGKKTVHAFRVIKDMLKTESYNSVLTKRQYRDLIANADSSLDKSNRILFYAECLDQKLVDTISVIASELKVGLYLSQKADILVNESELPENIVLYKQSDGLSLYDAGQLLTGIDSGFSDLRIIAPEKMMNEFSSEYKNYAELPLMYISSDKKGQYNRDLAFLGLPVLSAAKAEEKAALFFKKSYINGMYRWEGSFNSGSVSAQMLLDMIKDAVINAQAAKRIGSAA